MVSLLEKYTKVLGKPSFEDKIIVRKILKLRSDGSMPTAINETKMPWCLQGKRHFCQKRQKWRCACRGKGISFLVFKGKSGFFPAGTKAFLSH